MLDVLLHGRFWHRLHISIFCQKLHDTETNGKRWKQWCRGRVCKRTPKSFDLVKIMAKSVELWAKSVKILKSGQTSWKYEQKRRPMCFGLKKWRRKSHEDFLLADIRNTVFISTKSGPKFFRASLRRFGQKSFAPPKICLLLQLWMRGWTRGSQKFHANQCKILWGVRT